MSYTSKQIKKHGELILAWETQDPKPVIEFKNNMDQWILAVNLRFYPDLEYRIKPQLTREEITSNWVKENNIKVGDKVKLVEGIETVDIGYIIEIFEKFISVKFNNLTWTFPVECLEKVVEEYIPFTFEDNLLFRDKWFKYKKKRNRRKCF